jgi:tRNA nucleotidyltransferase/poly(A) polymerase
MGRKFLIEIPKKLAKVLEELPFAYLVGGSVRDALLGNPPKDLDIEVYQTNLDDLVKTLERAGKVDLVGKSFGVIKLTLDARFSTSLYPGKTANCPREGTRVSLSKSTSRSARRKLHPGEI